MTLIAEDISPNLRLLLQAIESLEANGYSAWLMEECHDEDNELVRSPAWTIRFQNLPEDLPVLESEISLLATVLREIMLLGGFEDTG